MAELPTSEFARGGCLHDLIRDQAAQHPDAVVILAPERRPLTYSRLYGQVVNIVDALNSLGIGRNDRVAMVLPDGPEAAVAFVSIAAAATCVPLNPAYRPLELEPHLGDPRCRALVVPAGCPSTAAAVARARGVPILDLKPVPDGEAGLFTLEPQGTDGRTARTMTPGLAGPDDVALVLPTSGTTARPKRVPLTHANLVVTARNIRDALLLDSGDRSLSVMPLFHIHGLSVVFSSIAAGASVVCPDGFSVDMFFDSMRVFQPSWYTAAPTIHREVLEHARRHPELLRTSTLRFIRSASAAIPAPLIADLEAVFHVPLIEAYGMTEAGPQIASNRLSPSGRKPGSVGRPAGPDVAIMNPAGEFAAPGQIGEVVIRGANVVRGYDDDAVPDPEAFDRGWFHTGDLGYLDDEGYLFISGRRKEIINRGGEKVSPVEVEAALMAHPAVDQAVAFALAHPTLGEDVASAITLRPEGVTEAARNGRPEMLIQEIRRIAASRLAPFKVPHAVFIVDDIPKGPTGKIQRTGMAERLALTTPGHATPAYTAPRFPLEVRLADIIADVLGTDRPGVDDNFFLSGGDSLKAARVVARLRKDLRVDLPLDAVFESPTIATLTEQVAAKLAENGREAIEHDGISLRDETEPTPLSFAQQRVWFLDQLDPGDPAYNMMLALRLRGPLREELLEESVNRLVQRHEMLRATFRPAGGQPVQHVASVRPVRIPVIDLARLPAEVRDAEAERLVSEEAAMPFHLAQGPLFRATLLRLAPLEHVVLLTMHHIISDAWSMSIIEHELITTYRSLALSRTVALPALPLRYADYAAWERNRRREVELAGHLEFWKQQLDGMPPALELPADFPRPPVRAHRGTRYRTVLSPRLTDDLRQLSQREGATLFMTMLGAFEVLLSRYTGETDFGVGTPIANRSRVETESVIGFFANTLVMRARLADDPSFREILARVRATALSAWRHQDLPFERLVEELHPERTHRHNPLFQVMFAFQNVPAPAPAAPPPDLTVTRLPVAVEAAKFDLTLYLREVDGSLEATWQYNTDLFAETRIARMAGHFQTLLHAIASDPDRRIAELPLLSGAEQRALAMWNATEISDPDGRCFHQLFAERARTRPGAIAVECGEERTTYGELERRANRVAGYLRASGLRRGSRVGVLLDRSVGMIVATLAVMKAGGVYVPLDPEYPEDHLEFVGRDAGLEFVLTERALASRLPSAFEVGPASRTLARSEGEFATVICVDDVLAGPPENDTDPVIDIAPSQLAYIIYTSGSTGTPKGVMITHANLSHYVHAMRAAVGIRPDDVYLHTASFAFSSSVRQFAVPLSCGARVVVAPAATIQSPESLFDLIKRRNVSVIDVVPSYWRICNRVLASLDPERRTDLLTNPLRLILSASEPLPADVVSEWRAFRHHARLINMFGQTETTGIVTVYPIPLVVGGNGAIVPIGRPIPDTCAYILDQSGQSLPVGVWGELYLGGPGIGLGYVDEPALTAARFVPDRWSRMEGARLYRTGDITRFLPTGDIEFGGRVDDQIKLHGYRIEPGHVEAVIARNPAWLEGAVVSRDEADGERRLVAYVVPKQPAQASASELRRFLRQQLPEYLVPSRIVLVAALPRTPSGKIDRAALRIRGAEPSDLGRDDDRAIPSDTASPAAEPVEGGAVQETLRGIWSQVLAVEEIGLDDNFFDMGGNSILSIRMIDLANRMGLRLTPKQLWQHQTVGELAPAVRMSQSGSPQEEPAATDRSPRKPEPAMDEPERKVIVTIESLRAYGREALERAGLVPEGAAIVTEVQLEASLRDQPTHNMVSIPRYARRLAVGTLNPRPNIRIERQTETSAHLDGDNGPGQWVAVVAMELAIRMARERGLAIVGVRRSNHIGAAGHYPWLAAREGLIGLCTTNGPVILAPTGGVTPTFGNNPIGVGIPAGRHHPIMLDIAMSVAPRGRIGLRLAEGKPLQPGWILDRDGRPSTDLRDLVAGLGVPIGGHKGYGLTFVMEVLAGVLTGANFGWDNRRAHGPEAMKPAGFGHFFMAIDPELFTPAAEFTARVERLIHETRSGERAAGVDEILVPGEKEMRAREQNLRRGAPLRPSTYQALRKYARSAALQTELEVVEWIGSAPRDSIGALARPASIDAPPSRRHGVRETR